MGHDQKFFKRNYVDAIEIVTPKVYQNRDLALSGKSLSPVAQLINGDISFIDKFRELLGPVSALPGTEFATVDTPEGFSNFFVKQNKLTNITPASFEKDILVPLGTKWTDFDSSAHFVQYLADTVLPIVTPSGTGFPAAFYDAENKESYINTHKFGTTASAVHLHFLRSLGLFYLLNRERPTDTYNIFTDQRSWFSNLNFESNSPVPGFEGPPFIKAGPDSPGGTGVVPNSQARNNPIRFNWEAPASTLGLLVSGLEGDPFGRDNTTRITFKYPDWSLPPQSCYCEVDDEPAINVNENDCYEMGGTWQCPEEGEATLGERTGAALRYKHNIEGAYASKSSIYFSFWARLKHFSASDLNTNPLDNGQEIRVTLMGNGKAGPNWPWAITPTWQQVCMRAYEAFAVEGTKNNKKLCKYFILPKWTDAGHGTGGEVFNGPPDPNFWHEGDEIEVAYPASYIPSLETGKSAVEAYLAGELHTIAPDISQYDYLKTSPSGGYGYGAANVETDLNEYEFLAWDSTNTRWPDVEPFLLNKWVTSKTRYSTNGAGYNIPGTRGRPRADLNPDVALGGNGALFVKDNGASLSPGGVRHDLILESQKDYKLTVYLAKQGQHYDPGNNNARQVVSLVEFSFSEDYPTSIGSKLDTGYPAQPVLDDTLSYHRLWINWSEDANQIDDVFSESHNTNVNGYSVEDMGSTGWYKVTVDLTIDPRGYFRNNPEGCKGMITVYPSRNYFKNGIDYSRSTQDPKHGRSTVRRARVSLGRVYLTNINYDIPDDYSAYGELFEWSYVKRNTHYKIWEGPYLNSSDPSGGVLKNFAKLYKGETLTTLEAVKTVEEYVWDNYYGTPDPYNVEGTSDPIGVDPNLGQVRGMRDVEYSLIPENYLSGVGQFEQGNQNLDNLQTLNDVVYSPLYLDKDDTKVKQALNTYFALGRVVSDKESIGPLHRFLQALGFLSFDINNQIESIRTLTSIQDCPSSLLPYLATIIGWKLYGTDESSWRRQLWNATELYKKKGSLAGLEHAMDVIIPNNPLLFNGQLDPEIAYNYLGDIDFESVGAYVGNTPDNNILGYSTNFIDSVYGEWGNRDNLLNSITRPEKAPYGSQVLGRFWAKDQYETADTEEGFDSYLVQDHDLYNQQEYTFSVYFKYVPYRNEAHHEQKSALTIKYPNVGPTYSETTIALRWATEGEEKGTPSGVDSFTFFNVPSPQNENYSPTNLHSSSIENVGNGWWRLSASLKINPLGDPLVTTPTRVLIRPGGFGKEGYLDPPDPPICEYGCRDPEANNYDEKATCDDGSCEYDGDTGGHIGGCMDPWGCNYNEDANYDDGSCDYYSCHTTQVDPATEADRERTGISLNSTINPAGETGAAYVWNPMVNVGADPGGTVGKTDRPLNKTYAEYYESYIPRLIYYLLQTDSKFFKDGNKWTEKLSDSFQINDYSPAEVTTNINYIVDHILKKAVGRFHDHFYISYMPFDVNITEDDEVYLGPAHQMVDGRWMTGKTHTPNDKYLKRVAGITYTDSEGDLIYGMAFNYRGRDYPIPPWEEEKFYLNCEVSNDFLDFLEEELIIFGVSEDISSKFRDYIAQRTCEGDTEFKAFNNSFLFFTSSLELPPNYEEIISTFDENKFDYLSMWNGKSSTFDVNVSAGTFDSDLFSNVPYDSDEFFQSLEVVNDFSPAKANPRTNAQLFGEDAGGGLDSICDIRTYSYDELIGDLSSVLAGYASSSVQMRASALGGIGGVVDSSYDFEGYGGANNHRYLSVFQRDQVNSLDDALIQGTSSVYEVSSATSPKSGAVGYPSATIVKRNSNRRRNYHSLLPTSNWYKRDGSSMPTFLNTNKLDFNPLGFIASSWKFEDVSSIDNYPAVWDSCQDSRSTTSYYGIKGTNTFPVRLSSELEFDECTNYQNRGQLDPMAQTINSIIERRADLEAKAIYELNKYNFDISGSWYDPLSVAKGSLTFGANFKDYEDFSVSLSFQRLYKDYTNQMDKHTLGSIRLEDYVDGGPNIFSHIYGPLYFNGNLSIAGSAVEDTSSNLIASSVGSEYIISLNASSAKIDKATNRSNIGTAVASSLTELFVGSYEFRNPHILSGVELVDTSSVAAKPNEFSLFKYNKDSARKYTNQFLNDNGVVVIKSVGALPRLRLSLKDYDQTKDAENKNNFLLPDHEFKLTISSIFGRDKVNYFGGGNIGAWLHTKPEYDYNNDLVFWYWSRERDWKMQKVSAVSGSGGISKVKHTYSHVFNYSPINIIEAPKDALSFYDVSGKPTINLIQERNLNKSDLLFNTNNKDVNTPIEYYKQNGQLHRKDQDYILEVFPFPSPSKDLYCLIDKISVMDITQRDRIKVPHSFSVPDFSPSLRKTPDKYEFYYSDGERAPLNTKVYFDVEGNMTTKYKGGLDKITLGIGRQDQTKIFYTQVSGLDPSSYFTSVSSIPDFGYVQGWLMKAGGDVLTPSSVSAVGRTAGTHTQKSIHTGLELLPEELITILRYYNNIATANASRVVATTSGVFEASGGSRASYRTNPIWDGSAIILESGQYSTVDLDN